MSIDTPKTEDHFDNSSGLPIAVCPDSYDYLKGLRFILMTDFLVRVLKLEIQMLNPLVDVVNLSLRKFFVKSLAYLDYSPVSSIQVKVLK